MEKPTEVQQSARENGAGMTRGTFIVTGAAAAAGAAARALIADPPAESASSAALSHAPACVTRTCPGGWDDGKPWLIPADVLNALWSHVLPRIVADGWRNNQSLVGWTEADIAHACTTTGAPAWNMAEGTFTASAPSVPVNPPQWPMSDWKGTEVFKRRLDLVQRYFSGKDRVMPIRIVGEGGFDFVLSSSGMDIFVPFQPVTLKEVLRFFSYRDTGRRSLGIPNYMISSTVTTESPVGPSMAEMSYDMVVEMIEAEGGDCAGPVKECLKMHRRLSDFQAIGVQAVDSLGVTTDRPLLRRARRLIPFQRRGFPRDSILLAEPRRPLDLRISTETYQCVMDLVRCWQVSGAVYRGIMTELPRIVAEIWLEEVNACAPDAIAVQSPATATDPLEVLSYSTRAVNADTGFRSIFKERLETALPDHLRMRFEQGSVPFTGADPQWWDRNDVMITHLGFHFPQIPRLAQLLPTGAAPTDLDALLVPMFQNMKDGTAGNPVFTDSQRTE